MPNLVTALLEREITGDSNLPEFHIFAIEIWTKELKELTNAKAHQPIIKLLNDPELREELFSQITALIALGDEGKQKIIKNFISRANQIGPITLEIGLSKIFRHLCDNYPLNDIPKNINSFYKSIGGYESRLSAKIIFEAAQIDSDETRNMALGCLIEKYITTSKTSGSRFHILNAFNLAFDSGDTLVINKVLTNVLSRQDIHQLIKQNIVDGLNPQLSKNTEQSRRQKSAMDVLKECSPPLSSISNASTTDLSRY